jgi:FkbM family methyltransferase
LIHLKRRFRLRDIRRAVFEAVGSDRFSHPSIHDIDRQLVRYLPDHPGVFVELGANDGYAQTNTYYLERWRGWTGVLIEPIPQLAEKARRLRKRSQVFQAACVPFDFSGDTISMTYSNLMSVVEGAMHDPQAEAEHVAWGARLQRLQPYTLIVPARTLTSILDEAQVSVIDLLSLDVEGYEADVLRGLDFARFRPHVIVAEARHRDEVDAVLEAAGYTLTAKLSDMDCVYVDR